jgi:hypothetical protein
MNGRKNNDRSDARIGRRDALMSHFGAIDGYVARVVPASNF